MDDEEVRRAEALAKARGRAVTEADLARVAQALARRAAMDQANAVPITVEEIGGLSSDDLFDRLVGRVFTVVDGDVAALRACDPVMIGVVPG